MRQRFGPRRVEGVWLWIALAAATLPSCGGDEARPDAAGRDSAAACSVDADCDDGDFCDGSERCEPGHGDADAAGCVASPPPCGPSAVCDEDTDRCVDDCATEGDQDADGHDSIACGGGDCDDADADRFPGNTEVCDPEGVDEDCDSGTFGDRDADADGAVDATCCNGELCGGDCDDTEAGVHPTATETCNGVDDDCDDAVDEGVTSRCWADADGDGYAAADAAEMQVCGDCGTGRTGREPTEGQLDCDDADAGAHPTAREICNGVDDDCSSGGGADPAEDMDGDGHTAADYVDCEDTPSSFPRDDCVDTDDRVFAGQTEYFTERRCGAGGRCECPDGRTGCVRRGEPCDCDEAWDYDCDGQSTPRPAGCVSTCAASGDCGAAGPVYDRGSPPSCGSLVAYASDCGLCNTAGSACMQTTSGRASPLGCR